MTITSSGVALMFVSPNLSIISTGALDPYTTPIQHIAVLNHFMGSDHMHGYICLNFQMFVISRVPFGTREPPMVQSSKDSCGADNGAGRWI